MARRESLPPILPSPQRAEPGEGSLRLRPDTPIVVGAPDDFAAARALQERIERGAGLRLPIETHARTADLGPRLELARTDDGGEGYAVTVRRDAARLLGKGRAGLRYAVETVAQLLDPAGRLPACEIEDAPDFSRRGLLLDVSRGRVPTPATLRDLVDRCARLKLNTLMLYVEHPFRFRRHPGIGADCSALDAETLRALDDYAASQHVELIPNLQSLGHMERILRLPPYAGLAETDARWTLAPENPKTYPLLRDLYDEYLPNFRSRRFHANCDEPWDLGRGQSKPRSDALGPGGLFLEHLKRVRALALEHERQLMVWADFVHAHPERIAELDRDLVLCDWGYEADTDYARVQRFTAAGLRFWVCPGTSSWNALFPRIANALDNITGWAVAGRQYGAEGLLLTEWGDFGHYNLLGANWLALAWAAQQAWSGDTERPSFERAFGHFAFGVRSREPARLYENLGACHEAGFHLANGSPLSFLFFDDLETGAFVRGARAPSLRRTKRRLEAVRERLERSTSLRGDPLTRDEVLWAADASLLAVEKALLGSRYFAWRADPTTLTARERRATARALGRLADSQQRLARVLRKLWLARNHLSNFSVNQLRIARSVRDLRRAARELERNRPSPPPPEHPGFAPTTVLAALRRATHWPPLPTGAQAVRRRPTRRR